MTQPDQPQKRRAVPNSLNSVLVIIEKPGDTTRKPRPPHIPPYSPRAIPPGLLRRHQPPASPEEKAE
jgi:hypothetical protein